MSEVQAGVGGRKWWASALMIGAVVGLASLVVGALGTKFGIWGFQLGFMMLAVGVVLATVCFFLGVIAFVLATVKKMPAERSAVLVGVVISVLILGLMGSQFMAARSVPPIHNISTDTENPPEFSAVVALREAEGANPLAYTEEVAEQQRKAYPQVKPLISNESKSAMVAKAEQVIRDLGMEVVATDAAAGRVEATDTTFWFGFKDDVVVRVRSEGSGSVVDVRSVSRVGQSDLGKNAARISEILNALGTG
jgi:uncharacterized protein (DUF1499 family)